MKRLSKKFSLPLHPEVLYSYSCDFLDPSLRHFYGNEENRLEQSFCYSFALEIYHKLLHVAKEKISFSELKPFLRKWNDQFFPLESLLILEEKNNHRLHHLMKAHEQLHHKNTEQLKTIIELNKTVMENDGDN